MERIIVYSLKKCPKCDFLKTVLDEKGIPYEVNINMSEMKRLKIRSVPVMVLGGRQFSYDEAIAWIEKGDYFENRF